MAFAVHRVACAQIAAHLTRTVVRPNSRRCFVVRADPTKIGDNDFGARDPFPEELASNFGDKVSHSFLTHFASGVGQVIGPANTEHLIKPPDQMKNVLGLQVRKCVPCEGISHFSHT